MQGLDKEITEQYGLEVKSLVSFKDAYMLTTPQGRRIVRKIAFSPERLLFIHGAKEHLVSHGFPNVDRYVGTVSGQPFFSYENGWYTMAELIEGRECSFDSDSDIRRASQALAELHRASAGYAALEGSKVQDELGRTPEYFTKRLDDLRKMRKQAKKSKGRFDQLFLEVADPICEMGERAVKALEASDYLHLTEKARGEQSFCHHDYTHHNILVSEGRTFVTNFEYCCYELRVYDIANLIRRKMRKCDWDICKAEMILDAYQSVSPLSGEELSVMGIMLRFPQKFWRVVNRYYNSRRSWSERSFVIRLQEVIDEMEPHRRFMEGFERYIAT